MWWSMAGPLVLSLAIIGLVAVAAPVDLGSWPVSRSWGGWIYGEEGLAREADPMERTRWSTDWSFLVASGIYGSSTFESSTWIGILLAPTPCIELLCRSGINFEKKN